MLSLESVHEIGHKIRTKKKFPALKIHENRGSYAKNPKLFENVVGQDSLNALITTKNPRLIEGKIASPIGVKTMHVQEYFYGIGIEYGLSKVSPHSLGILKF